MTKDEALKQALEALEAMDILFSPLSRDCTQYNAIDRARKAITAIKQALAAPVQPVAWMHVMDNTEGIKANGKGIVSITQKRKHPFGKPGVDFSKSYPVTSTPLYTTPPNETASLAAQDLQTELEATNRQVEILSDALAESRREVAALKAVQEPVAWGMQNDDGQIYDCITPEQHASHEGEYTVPLYTTPPAAPVIDKSAAVRIATALGWTPPAPVQKQRWAVFCGGCRKEWSVSYPHPGKSICNECEAKLKEKNNG
jgi:hypothetical protein